MAESLPLIPAKGVATCSDVRGVLRHVFQQADSLPPLAPHDLPPTQQWTKKYDADRKQIWIHEDELKQQYAKRISRQPLPNIYKLQPASLEPPAHTPWREHHGILDRADLRPTINQNCDAEDTLWVRNILARSSGDLALSEIRGVKLIPTPPHLPSETSFLSMSIGEHVPRAPPPPPARPAPPPAPEHVLCIPPSLEFVNFTVGMLHTQSIRLVNVSRVEVRLSVRPPTCAELDLELCSARGLTLTSGASAEIQVHFRARSVREVRDEVVVRVSTGRELRVSLACYMQPPILDILVPALCTSVFSCTMETESETSIMRSTDCLELGARLLGDVHCVQMLFHCSTEHASFFLLTEDAWLSFSLDAVTSSGSLVAPPFVVVPTWWHGGGVVQGRAWCMPPTPGLHAAALRLVSTTAVVRPLHLIADALYFRPEHITIKAHEKEYDICSADDPACEHYLHLGTAFPHHTLSATVQLVNHSPIVYHYYWSVRPWGVCSCWEERDKHEEPPEESPGNKQSEGDRRGSSSSEVCSDDSSGLCVGAREARDRERLLCGEEANTSTSQLRVEAARGCVCARAACDVYVCARVGDKLGVHRAVLMLILKGIPKESLPEDYDAMIVRTDVVESDDIPGVKKWRREVCDVVCTQMEVWWEVTPVRFAIDPPVVHLNYSRRVPDVKLTLRATQLFGSEGVSCVWRVGAHVAGPEPAVGAHVAGPEPAVGAHVAGPEPARLCITPAHSCTASVRLHLPALPNHYPETQLITLESECGAWSASSSVQTWCSTRTPALRAPRRWLGVVPPGASVHALLQLHNDTYQHICWWATAHRWHGENPAGAACVGRAPCHTCHQRECTCAIIRPARGALHHGDTADIVYSVNAPQSDGCVATLIQAVRTYADVCRVPVAAGTCGRAALVAYRVLAPRLVLRVLPCGGDKHDHCAGCTLDGGTACSARGTAVLRPGAALCVGLRSCYRVRVTNLTPTDTSLVWEPPLEEDYLRVIFLPNEFKVRGHQHVTIQVVLEARRVCARRVCVRRARVLHACKPLYLLVDAAVAGLEMECEFPLGGGENTDCSAIMRRTQRTLTPDARYIPTSTEPFGCEATKPRRVAPPRGPAEWPRRVAPPCGPTVRSRRAAPPCRVALKKSSASPESSVATK